MDLRIEKTKTNIVNAFIELRAKKPLEKITVKELSDLARINKSTFYRHYEDVYALSDELEDEVIHTCLDMLPEPDLLFEADGIRILTDAFLSQSELFDILFSGSRILSAVHKLHDRLMEKILSRHPEYQYDLGKKVTLTALIYGMFHAWFIYKEDDFNIVISSLSELNQITRDCI
ncbi:TetR/AcrR family transcriptional regulator [Agathobacter sp.]|uniref:TetR/AcrR family transcriptional regulator n=1 Tax=Agathobacter sp. TaxID=2021311 RepID=UPI003FD8A410